MNKYIIMKTDKEFQQQLNKLWRVITQRYNAILRETQDDFYDKFHIETSEYDGFVDTYEVGGTDKNLTVNKIRKDLA